MPLFDFRCLYCDAKEIDVLCDADGPTTKPCACGDTMRRSIVHKVKVLGPSTLQLDAMTQAARTKVNGPSDVRRLQEDFAAKNGVDREQIEFGNRSAEIAAYEQDQEWSLERNRVAAQAEPEERQRAVDAFDVDTAIKAETGWDNGTLSRWYEANDEANRSAGVQQALLDAMAEDAPSDVTGS